ncbi:MAG TPA: glycosyltransferase, partial [Candidatus Sulfomarinibacteraceae bacterium]|nr:glycosyltransferase [Candidatus Sulfomarinibacteraceae bacterium]
LPQLGYGTQLSRSGRWLTRLSLRLARTVTAGSPLLQAQARPYLAGTGARLLPLGVDTALFYPDPASQAAAQSSSGERGPRLLHVGSLVPVKDQATLLEAFAEIVRDAPRARLDVVGEGPLLPALERQARSLGLQRRVTFHGAVPHHHLPPFYRRADLFLLSSRFESQNLAFLEAAACGLPTVGSAVGLLPALLPAACLAPPGDAPALAAAALELLQDPARRRALARELRRRVVRELTIEGTVGRLVGMYGGLGIG